MGEPLPEDIKQQLAVLISRQNATNSYIKRLFDRGDDEEPTRDDLLKFRGGLSFAMEMAARRREIEENLRWVADKREQEKKKRTGFLAWLTQISIVIVTGIVTVVGSWLLGFLGGPAHRP